MLKNIIEILKRKIEYYRSEEYYVEEIIFMQKDLWHLNMNDDKIFLEINTYLNKIKLNSEKHPFLVEFKDKSNFLLNSKTYSKEERHKLLSSLYEYRRNLNTSNN